ncbi:hypothetical protein [Burkholderia cenocepacia]|uniref:Uncharacterized protein n=1 Tax=Burkholderia cenocepacia TaxID=95486 RepID=A0A3Q9FB70_9BURK|nr:hypothetical protein [Burkholderia cenocepacia]AZQ53297.1 hypothetical protein D5R55_20245 [Burkholderia cenocepacia]
MDVTSTVMLILPGAYRSGCSWIDESVSSSFAAALALRLREAIATFERRSGNASVVRSDVRRAAMFHENCVVLTKIYAGALDLKNIFKK